MLEKHITISKTARYFLLGDPSGEIDRVWFVCHGYGQLASYFLKNFEVLDNGKNLIVAPEGLHRFYWNGFEGKVVACWMTKEDRLNDISDYVNYLDKVYEEVIASLKNRNVKITVLGFSQGVATVTRWLTMGKAKPEKLILWAGIFPPDLKFDPDQNIFNQMDTRMVVGMKDPFLKEIDLDEYEKVLKNTGIKYQLIRFDGKHEIEPSVLLNL